LRTKCRGLDLITAHYQNVWLISVPAGRFVVVVVVVVAVATLSHRAKLPGGVQPPQLLVMSFNYS